MLLQGAWGQGRSVLRRKPLTCSVLGCVSFQASAHFILPPCNRHLWLKRVANMSPGGCLDMSLHPAPSPPFLSLPKSRFDIPKCFCLLISERITNSFTWTDSHYFDSIVKSFWSTNCYPENPIAAQQNQEIQNVFLFLMGISTYIVPSMILDSKGEINLARFCVYNCLQLYSSLIPIAKLIFFV